MKNIISVSGRICSGKSYVANLISEKFKFPIASFGEYLRYYCLSNKLPTDRKTLQEIGDGFIKENPKNFLIDVLNHFGGDSDSIVLDGVRHKVIFDTICNLTLHRLTVFVDADIQTRAKRCYERNIESDNFATYEKFIQADNHRVEEEIESLKLQCDIIVDSTKEFKDELFGLISTYLKANGQIKL